MESRFQHAVTPKWLGCLALALTCLTSAFAADPEMRIRLKDGSFGNGTIVATPEPDRLAWQANGLVEPFLFDLQAVRSVMRILDTTQVPRDPVAGEQQIEMTDGGLIVGKLLEINDQWIIVQSSLLGTIQIDRANTLAIVDAGYAGQLVYSGPLDDEKWQRLSDDQDWEFEAGTLVATKQGATVVGNVGLPAKSQINLTMTWRGAPDFVLSFGTLATNRVSKVEEVPSAARLEVWDKQLALVREVDGGADIAMLSDLSGSNPRIELTVYLDQDTGTVVVCDAHGRLLETLKVPANRVVVRPSVHLANHGPSLAIEHFEVRSWDGVTSTVSAGAAKSILASDGQRIDGVIAGFDSQNQKLLIQKPDGDQIQLPLADLRRGDLAESVNEKPKIAIPDNVPPPVVQPPQLEQAAPQTESQLNSADAPDNKTSLPPQVFAPATNSEPAKKAENETATAGMGTSVEVILTDRSRLNGRWLAGDGQDLQFQAQGISQPLRLSPTIVSGLIGTNDRFTIDLTKQKNGTLKIGESELAGHLLLSSPTGSRSGLHWQPHGSHNAAEVSLAASGAIIYRQALPVISNNAGAANNLRIRVVAPAVGMFLGGNMPKAKNGEVEEAERFGEITFRSGDTIDGNVHSIDENGMKFDSSQTQTTFATHDQIQHVWLNRLRGSADTSPEKLERLMTVPRAMKKDPPTHLFISTTGDYLRGRLVRMEGETVSVEVRLEIVELPRSQIAQVVWLHDRDWSDQKTDGDTPEPAADVPPDIDQPFQVHAIASVDRGLTFQPQATRDGFLVGSSPLLGDCSVAIQELSQLLFGRNVAQQVRAFREDPWTLSLAQYPRVFLDDGGTGGAGLGGSDSALVGQPAPDFTLKTLDGQDFRLSKNRDRIVVLDFWASWCGPCIQTMPQVEQVVHELGAENIHLVAVNIQETATRAQIAVDRLEMAATVVLDSDGQTAAVYGANAIPQTVIIGRDGTVTHVFVGGGPKFVTQFRETLQALLQ